MKDLRELHEEFIQECRYSGKMRAETLRGYEACFSLLLKVFPEATLDILTPQTMGEFFKRLETRERVVGKNRVRAGIKGSTVATYRNKLNKFFTWLTARDYMKLDPFKGVPYPEVSYTNRKYLEKEDVEKIFGAVAFSIEWQSTLLKRRNLAILSVLLYCGLRKGELIGLKLLDVDLENRELMVRAETSKSKRNRVIPLNSSVLSAIKEYLHERRTGRYTTPYLWVSAAGDERLTIDGFKHFINKVNEKSKVKFHPHQFRHTFAVNFLNGGGDIYKLKQILGHVDIRMTCAYLRCLPTKALQGDVERMALANLL